MIARKKSLSIPKMGKSDYGFAKSYRPITLSSFSLKTLERIIQWYILEHHITERLPLQHAYTKICRCESAISTLVDSIEKSIYNGHKTLVVSLDCLGAFDRILCQSMGKAMQIAGLPNCIINWYKFVLEYRKVLAEVQGQQ